MSNAPHPLQCLDSIAAIRSCHGRQEICRPGQAANTWYRVLSGAALSFVIKSDGRRQIVDLLCPGDFFGFTPGTECDYTVEAAASGTIVAGYPRKRVETLADSDPQLAREIRQIAFDRLSRLQEQLLIVGRVRAQQKVGSFILAMADRLSRGQNERVTLPVSRYEIADYLAVSVETVSRALSDLKQRGLIRFAGTRTIQIMDRDALEDGEHDDVPARVQALSARISSHPSPDSFARTAIRTASAN
jgi:CRP/FNR family nitrogen fixation transcriptional regulator